MPHFPACGRPFFDVDRAGGREPEHTRFGAAQWNRIEELENLEALELAAEHVAFALDPDLERSFRQLARGDRLLGEHLAVALDLPV